jgi:hypothetical protein
MAAAEVKIQFHKLLGFRNLATLADDRGVGLNEASSQPERTASAMAKTAGAIFNKGGELATCESNGTS